jgi:Asp-tRNA(Asn)/Glu-tRNA(Gln) amidotransferase A subunit family amidase
VAWTFDLGDLPVQPEVRAVLTAQRERLEQAGCSVADAAPGLSDADEVFQVLRAALMAGLAPLLRDHREQVKATLAWNIEKGIALTGEQIAAARAQHAEIFARVKAFLTDGGYEVLALPTVQVLPFPVEQEWVREINGEPMATYIDWMRSCSRITVSAHPAVSVPAGLAPPGLAPSALAPPGLAPSALAPSALAPSGLAPSGLAASGLAASGLAASGLAPSGLPVGLQLVGRYGGDRRLLEIAAGIMALPG